MNMHLGSLISTTADIETINEMIVFLEWARDNLKMAEGAELQVFVDPDTNALEFQVIANEENPHHMVILRSQTF